MFNLLKRSDVRQVRQVLSGQSEAFGPLVERYLPAVYAVSYAYLGNHVDAEDVTQEAFVSAYTSLHTLKEPKKFEGWVVSIARQTASKLRRKQRREGIATAALPTDAVQQPDPGREELRRLLRAEIERMDDEPREVLLLHYHAGMNAREIATALDINREAVKKRLQRARQTLSENLLAVIGEEARPKTDYVRQRRLIMGLVGAAGVGWGTGAAATGGVALASVIHTKFAGGALAAAVLMAGAYSVSMVYSGDVDIAPPVPSGDEVAEADIEDPVLGPEELKDIVLSRSNEITTLRVNYVLTQEHLVNANTFERHHTFRFDGQNIYDAEERIDAPKTNIPPMSIAATLGGIASTYHGPSDTQPYHRKDGRIGGDNRDVRPYGAYMTPPDLWGDFPLDPLKLRYKKGAFSMREGADGRLTLLHVSPKGRRTDVILDEKLRIIGITEGRLPEDYLLDNYLENIPRASLFDDVLVCVTEEIAIEDFKTIDGVDFPLSATRNTYWSTLKEIPGSDRDSVLDYVEAWSAPGNREKRTVQELNVDADTLEVNQNMTEADFMIEFPEGTKMVRLLG